VKWEEVERWLVTVVDRIEQGLRVEDDRVECKRQLIDHTRAARRLAGHANQARSDRILWIIGVDEDASPPSIVGLQPGAPDPADWWARVEAKFDREAPSPVFVHHDVGAATLLGIGFDTSRLPFVIQLPTDNPNREVPWREGTYIRSANRVDLLKLLVPLTDRPDITMLDGYLEVVGERHDHRDGPPDFLALHGRANLYVDCRSALVIPDHRCSGRAILRSTLELDLDVKPGAMNANRVEGPPWSRLFGPPPSGLLAEQGHEQVVIHGPSPIWLSIRGQASTDESVRLAGPGRLYAELQTAGPDTSTIRLDVELVPTPPDELPPNRLARWTIHRSS
jgi:hypothetical protein